MNDEYEMKEEYDLTHAVRGPVVSTPSKTRITIRLDDEVLEWFRARVHAMGGGNYQTLMNAALRDHIARQEEPLEDTLRRVLREELGIQAADQRTPQRTVRAKARRQKLAADMAANPKK
jgi:uncharacterized protein (DUF4415 family)